MTDLTITATSVVPGSGATIERQYAAGAAVTAGQLVYLESATNTYKLADADSATAEARTVRGVALHAASIGQPLSVQTLGPITIGATVAAGVGYFASATAGGICPVADLATGMYPTFLGWGISATQISLSPVAAGVVR